MNEALFRQELNSRKLRCRRMGDERYQILTPWKNNHSFQLGPDGWVLVVVLPNCASTVEQEVRDIRAAAAAVNLPLVQVLD